MPKRADDFIDSLSLDLANAARLHVTRHIPSRELRRVIQTLRIHNGLHKVWLEPYWAYYVHEGRGAIPQRGNKLMVWFRDPTMDPRLNRGVTPYRVSQRRHLSPSQFRYWQKRNRAAERAGLPKPMIIAKKVGPVASTPFFSNSGPMASWLPKAKQAAGRRALAYLREKELKRFLQVESDTAIARFP